MHPREHNKLELGAELPPIPDDLIREIFSYLPVKSVVRFRLVCKSWNSLFPDTDHSVKQHKVIIEILSHLPVKLLLSCKVVCKLWNSLISSTHFAKKHLQCSAANTQPHELSIVPSSAITFIGSCNGLVCLKTIESRVCFLNPATRSVFKSAKVNFMDCGCSDSYGFGYDHVSDTYKVVLVPDYRRINSGIKVKVFSMGDTNWRDTELMAPLLIGRNRGHRNGPFGVHLNGTLNWLASSYTPNGNESLSEWDSDQCMVFSFDLNKEESVTLSLPRPSVKFNRPNLDILGECLCISHTDKDTRNFVVWQIKEFGVDASWTKLLNITFGLFGRYYFSSPSFQLCMFDNGDEVAVYDRSFIPLTNTKFDLLRILINNVCRDNVIIYSQSLISPC